MLGVRLFGDIEVSAVGIVSPGTGGMSVAPDHPKNLPRHRRPPEYGGIGADPVWRMNSADLPQLLRYTQDSADASRHGFVEPTEVMSLDDYQEALAASRTSWIPA